MSDWLDKIQQQKNQERIDLENHKKRVNEEYWNHPMGVGIKRNRAKIKSVYENLANEINQAIKVGNFPINIKEEGYIAILDHLNSHFIATFGGEFVNNSFKPLRTLTLWVHNDEFKINFERHYRPNEYVVYSHHTHREQVSMTDVNEKYISYLIEWLATDQPEFKPPTTKPKGIFGKLFG